MKTLSFLVLAFFGISASLTTASSKFKKNNPFCDAFPIKSILPLGAGCHYTVVFQKSAGADEIVYEKLKLDAFVQAGYYDPHIHWYKKKFDTRYRDIFDYSIDHLDQAHWSYIQLDPTDVDEHIRHVSFLVTQDQPQLAQRNVDEYCRRFIPQDRKDVLHSINLEVSSHNNLGNIDFKNCGLHRKIAE